MSNLAIIPARSGSKGIKDKNIRDLCGKQLMAHTIEAALFSDCFDEVMVSTDSDRYSEITRKYGANVPFLRNSETATDKASTWDMAEEVLENYSRTGRQFDSFCILQPTSPLRTASDVREAYRIYDSQANFAVVSVCEAEHSPLWCGHLPENLELVNFIDKESTKQRQAGNKFYRLNGAIYIVNTERFYHDRFLYQKGSFAYIMPQNRSVDIDTEIGFKLAKIILGGYYGVRFFNGNQRPASAGLYTAFPNRRCA